MDPVNNSSSVRQVYFRLLVVHLSSSAREFMDRLVNQKPFTPQVAKDMVDRKVPFSETQAGQQLQGELFDIKKKLEAVEEQTRAHLADLEKKKHELNEAFQRQSREMFEHDAEIRRKAKERVERMKRDVTGVEDGNLERVQKALDCDLKRLRWESAKREREMNERHHQEQSELLAKYGGPNPRMNTLESALLENLVVMICRDVENGTEELERVKDRLRKAEEAQVRINQRQLW